MGPLVTDLGGAVTALAFNPDGSLLAIADDTLDVQLWDTRTGRRAGRPLTGLDQPARHLAFSLDGSRLYADDATFDVAELVITDGRPVDPDRPEDSSEADHDFNALSDREVDDFDIDVEAMTVGNDGYVLAASTPSGVAVWDGEIWLSRGGRRRTLHAQYRGPAAFSPGGEFLATIGPATTVQLWVTATGRRTAHWTDPEERSFIGVAFTPDGQQLVLDSGFELVVWKPSDPVPLSVLAEDTETTGSLACSPDGTLVAASGRAGTLSLWEMLADQSGDAPVAVLTGANNHPTFSADGRLLAAADGKTVHLWAAVEEP